MSDKFFITMPFDPKSILRKKKGLKRKLMENSNFLEKRICVVGGSTTSEIIDILDLFLLDAGIKASFFQGEFNGYFEELIYPNPELEVFKPDLIDSKVSDNHH